MIKLTFKFLMMAAVVIFPGFLFAQKAGKDNAGKIVYGPEEQTVLWKVSSPHFPGPSYIFGTMHILCDADAKLSDALKNVIAEVDKVYFEIELDNMTEMMGSFRDFNMLDGQSLKNLISEDDYKRLDEFLKMNKVMLPLQMMEKFKPLLISSMLSQSMMGCEQVNGMENVIMAEAQEQEKEILGLETIAFQAGIFDSIPYDEQAKMLMNYFDSMDNYRKVTEEMVNAYLTQDLNKITDLMVNSDPSMEKYMDLLLHERNHNWIDKMLSQMVEAPALFAVGAGHLPGEQGVLALLKQRGYKVEPVKNKF